MNRIYRSLISAVFAAAGALLLRAGADAAANGISVSDSDPAPGSGFTVTVTVPPSENADTLSVKAQFAPEVFEVISWEPVLENSVRNSGEDFFVLTSANAARVIDLSGGLVMKAEMSVKENAPAGNYSIKLTEHSITYVKDNGRDYEQLWEPTVTEAEVRVAGSYAQARTLRDNDTAQPRTTADNTAAPVPEKPLLSADRTLSDDPPDEGTVMPGEEQVIVDEEIEEPYRYVEAAEPPQETAADNEAVPDALPVSGQAPADAAVNIFLTAELDGLPGGQIHTSTKRDFFSGDTQIALFNSAEAENDAESAAAALGSSGRGSYAFGISVTDMASGRTINSLPDGYIEFTIPVPLKFTDTSGLVLYRVSDGYPRYTASALSSENGVNVMTFRTDHFSRYMIVDTVTPVTVPAERNMTVTGKEAPAPAGKPLNPDTGAAAAVTIPAALAGCVFLAGKQIKHRKRRKIPTE